MKHTNGLVKVLATVAAFSATLCVPAAAGVVNAELVYDLSTEVNNSTHSFTVIEKSLTAPISVTSGDTVKLSVGFKPGQALRWNGTGQLNAWLGSDYVSSFTATNTALSFSGLSTGTQWTTSIADTSSCCAHIGPTGTISGDGVAREFTGLQLSFDVVYANGGTRSFDHIGWNPLFTQGTVEAVQRAEVPEPASITLLGLGMLGFAATRRKRSK